MELFNKLILEYYFFLFSLIEPVCCVSKLDADPVVTGELLSVFVDARDAISFLISRLDSNRDLSVEWMFSFCDSKWSRALSISFNCASSSSTSAK